MVALNPRGTKLKLNMTLHAMKYEWRWQQWRRQQRQQQQQRQQEQASRRQTTSIATNAWPEFPGLAFSINGLGGEKLKLRAGIRVTQPGE